MTRIALVVILLVFLPFNFVAGYDFQGEQREAQRQEAMITMLEKFELKLGSIEREVESKIIQEAEEPSDGFLENISTYEKIGSMLERFLLEGKFSFSKEAETTALRLIQTRKENLGDWDAFLFGED